MIIKKRTGNSGFQLSGIKRYLRKEFIFASLLLFGWYPIHRRSTVIEARETKYQNKSNDLENSSCVFSYLDIFNERYEKNDIVKSKISFEDFYNGYYKQKDDIDCYIKKIESVNFIPTRPQKSEISIQSSLEFFSPDEDYILNNSINDESTTKQSFFKREPQYTSVDFSKIQDGDILLEMKESPAGKLIGHTAFINNISHSSFYGNYIQTIESVASGVQFGFLDDNRAINFQVMIFRVYRARELGLTKKAKEFMTKQLGKGYSTDYSCTHIGNQEKWYCSEVIYAAYYDAGVDILYDPYIADSSFDYNKKTFVPTLMKIRFFGGKILDFDPQYLDISIEKFENKRWYINVLNSNNFACTIIYNSKMCFLNDAISWNLNKSDIRTATIDPNSSYEVCISENFFATSVAISYFHIDTRYVTAADGLDKNKLVCNIYHSKL